MVIVVCNLLGKFIDGSVYHYGIFATTIGSTGLRIPYIWIHRSLGANLFPFGIYTDLAQ